MTSSSIWRSHMWLYKNFCYYGTDVSYNRNIFGVTLTVSSFLMKKNAEWTIMSLKLEQILNFRISCCNFAVHVFIISTKYLSRRDCIILFVDYLRSCLLSMIFCHIRKINLYKRNIKPLKWHEVNANETTWRYKIYKTIYIRTTTYTCSLGFW